jgi:UDP-2,3-diacylglucosamine hydrolase
MRDIYYFISDIHLGVKSNIGLKEQETILIKFLDEIKNNAKELFIVGDLFDCWIEYKHVVPKGFYRFFAKIDELVNEGVKITYLSGNHDFWYGNYFKDEFGIEIIHHPIAREIEEKKFYIHHGDGLVYKDTGYKILKAILRNKVSQFLYSLLHPDIGIWLAKKSSVSSRKYTKRKNFSPRDGLLDFAVKKLKEGYDFILMGHRHFAFTHNEGKGTYVNLGDWIKIFSYGEFKNGEFKLKKFYNINKKQVIALTEREIKQEFAQE